MKDKLIDKIARLLPLATRPGFPPADTKKYFEQSQAKQWFEDNVYTIAKAYIKNADDQVRNLVAMYNQRGKEIKYLEKLAVNWRAEALYEASELRWKPSLEQAKKDLKELVAKFKESDK